MSREHPMVLFAHPTGNQNSRNALRSLVENNMLASFWTTICWDENSRWNRVLPENISGRLNRRSFPEAPAARIHTVPAREALRQLLLSLGLKNAIGVSEKPYSVIGVYRHFDKQVSRWLKKNDVDAVYAFEGAALNTFRAAKEKGIPTIYELPSSYWYWNQRLLKEEMNRSPEYAGLLNTLCDVESHLKWKDEELALADHVIVPSSHVRLTLTGAVEDDRIHVVNYGAPHTERTHPEETNTTSPLRVLYVGALQQRKGIGYLLQAIEVSGLNLQVTLVGMRDATNPKVDEACLRYRWFESLPHDKILKLMSESDILVHPSLSEGCSLVVLEALANNLPVIVTPNSGTLEFVRNGMEGFVVPVCDAKAIAGCLVQLDQDRKLLKNMALQAGLTARMNDWMNYRAKWANAVKAAICK